jgi:hypothetical protein
MDLGVHGSSLLFDFFQEDLTPCSPCISTSQERLSRFGFKAGKKNLRLHSNAGQSAAEHR